jgi:hypothetical protein
MVSFSWQLGDVEKIELPSHMTEADAIYLKRLLNNLLSENLHTMDEVFHSDYWDDLQRIVIDEVTGGLRPDIVFLTPFFIYHALTKPQSLLTLLNVIARPPYLLYKDNIYRQISTDDLLSIVDGEHVVEEFKSYPYHFSWVSDWKKARDMIAAGSDYLKPLLSHDDPEVREEAASLLGSLHREKPEIKSWLIERQEQEFDIEVEATLSKILMGL